MTLADVIKASTWRAAQVIRHEELGHLTPGALADIAAFRVRNGEFRFYDAFGASAAGKQRLQCELTLKDGKVVWNWNGLGQQDWQKLGPTYGVREMEQIVRPPRPR
jgi:dihydroorotase